MILGKRQLEAWHRPHEHSQTPIPYAYSDSECHDYLGCAYMNLVVSGELVIEFEDLLRHVLSGL